VDDRTFAGRLHLLLLLQPIIRSPDNPYSVIVPAGMSNTYMAYTVNETPPPGCFNSLMQGASNDWYEWFAGEEMKKF
jgi:hypothetical protein